MKAARTCKEDGCAGHASHRGMCQRHYSVWRKLNPGVSTYRDTEDAVMDALPGTVGEICAMAGISWEGARRALDDLHEAKRLHVGEWQPPIKPGARWLPRYVAGEGEDVKLTFYERKEHRMSMRRARDSRRKAVAQIRTIAPGAGWAATLLTGI